MVKKKDRKGSDKSATSVWLRESKRTHDASILRKLISKTVSWQIAKEKLDTALFEKTYGLKSIPKAAVSNDMLNRALGHEKVRDEIKISMGKVQPKGKTLVAQIRSLLPNLPDDEIQSLSYAFSRIVTERIPKETRWPFVPEGLDALTAALLDLYIIARTVNQEVPWLLILWKLKVKEAKVAALESIQKSLKQDTDSSTIEAVMKRAERDISIALGQDSKFDITLSQDPLSDNITKWIKQISSKKSNLQETKADLIEIVQEKIAGYKGYTSTLENKINVHDTPITNWDILALRSDGPAADAYEPLLQLIRDEINILRHDPIRNMCLNLANLEEQGHPSLNDFNEVSDLTGRTAYYELHRLEPLFNECYIPTLRKIGLRYRFIFIPKQKPGILSEGLIERMILLKRKKDDDEEPKENEMDTGGCMIHIEPNWSQGPDPRKFQKGTCEAVAEDEIVSLNLNHFDFETGKWIAEIPDAVPREKQKDSLLIQRSTISGDRTPCLLSERQSELIGLLWSLQGPRSQRKWLLDSVGYSQQTATRMIRIMLKNQVLRLLYLPALEFSGLPDGLIAYANCIDRRSRDKLVNYIIESQPFTRTYIGDSNDVITRIRVPLMKTTSVVGDLREKLPEYSDCYLTARLRSSKTYRIATIHKLMNPKTETWINPWKGMT